MRYIDADVHDDTVIAVGTRTPSADETPTPPQACEASTLHEHST